MGLCAFLEVPHGIVRILEVPYEIFHEELPKRHKIPQRTSKNAQNPMRNFQKCTNSQEKLPAFLEVPHVILCSFGSSLWDFVHFWKFLVGLCIFESSSWDCAHFGSSSWDFVHHNMYGLP
jgi:hypothetical protein